MSKKQSVVTQTLKLAERKYKENPAITAMHRMVVSSQMVVASDVIAHDATVGFDILRGYARGVAGEDGYSPPAVLDLTTFTVMIRRMDHMRTFTEHFTMLVIALQALGETIDY